MAAIDSPDIFYLVLVYLTIQTREITWNAKIDSTNCQRYKTKLAFSGRIILLDFLRKYYHIVSYGSIVVIKCIGLINELENIRN